MVVITGIGILLAQMPLTFSAEDHSCNEDSPKTIIGTDMPKSTRLEVSNLTGGTVAQFLSMAAEDLSVPYIRKVSTSAEAWPASP